MPSSPSNDHDRLQYTIPNKSSNTNILPPLPVHAQEHSSTPATSRTRTTILPPLPVDCNLRVPSKRLNIPDPSNLREFVAHLVKVGHVNCVEYILALSYLNRLASCIEKYCSNTRVCSPRLPFPSIPSSCSLCVLHYTFLQQ